MKGIVSVLTVLILSLQVLFSASLSAYPVTAVILDAGHGGYDPGAVGYVSGTELLEKELTLALALRVGEQLERKNNLDTFYTRIDDSFISLEDRLALVNSINPGPGERALVVSLHFNASDTPDANGFEALVKEEFRYIPFISGDAPPWRISYFSGVSLKRYQQELQMENVELGRSLSEAFSGMFPESRGRGIKEQNIYILNGAIWPAVLFESAFLTNPEESSMLSDPEWMEKASDAIVEGILRYIDR